MKIAEIFDSIHGEVNGHHQGRMCTFIRISGCLTNCWYCDTKHTQDPNYGIEMSHTQIIQRVKNLNNKYICITGGEPLLNKNEVSLLLQSLWARNYKISVETNGSIPIDPFYEYVDSFIIDYKIGVEKYQSVLSNYYSLRSQDVIKFVVEESTIKKAIQMYSLFARNYEHQSEQPIFAFSPILSKTFTANHLYSILRENNIHNVVVSLQIHKFANFQ